MTPHTIPQTVLFPDLFDKPLVATFNRRAYSGAFRRLDAWLDGRMLEDVTLAECSTTRAGRWRAPRRRWPRRVSGAGASAAGEDSQPETA